MLLPATATALGSIPPISSCCCTLLNLRWTFVFFFVPFSQEHLNLDVKLSRNDDWVPCFIGWKEKKLRIRLEFHKEVSSNVNINAPTSWINKPFFLVFSPEFILFFVNVFFLCDVFSLLPTESPYSFFFCGLIMLEFTRSLRVMMNIKKTNF